MNKVKTILLLLLTVFCANGYADDSHANKYQYRPYLTVQEINNEGHALVLNDGSQWDIQYYGGLWRLVGYGWVEKENVAHWSVGDFVEVQYPGSSGNFFDFHLVLVNISQDEEVLATLKQAPSADHKACLWISDYNEKNNHFVLSNGSAWVKGKKDLYGAFFGKHEQSKASWQPGDPVTLLSTDGVFNKGKILVWNHATNEMPDVHPIN